MVFVRRSAGRSGSTKVQLAERVDGRNRILEHVGTARSAAELAVLVAEAERRMHSPGQQALELTFDAADGADGAGGVSPADVSAGRAAVVASKECRVLWQVLTAVYARLGFDAVHDAGFEQMVLARVVEPVSKLDSIRVLDELGVEHVSLRTMRRSIARARNNPDSGGEGLVNDAADVLVPDGSASPGPSAGPAPGPAPGPAAAAGRAMDYRSILSAACFAYAASAGDVSLCLYDVTTLYFEVEKEDELRKVGFSKERRVDPQVVVGLLVDRGGFPLEISCWSGNQAETATIVPTIKRFQDRHGLADMVVVADAGMLSTSNLSELDRQGLRFIVGSRVTKAPGDLASHFRWHGDVFTDGQVIDTLTPRRATAAARSENDPARKAEPVWDPAAHPGSWRAVWAYSRKRAVRDGVTLTAQENRAKAVVAGDKPAKKPRFVTTTDGALSLDEASLTRARRLAGLKGYVTNIPADVMPAAEVISSYHDLWRLEQSFRMSKTDLRARPVFHQQQDTIEAHLSIVFAALAVARYLQDVTGFSIRKLVRTLKPLQHITIRVAGHTLHADDPLTPDAQTILTALKSLHPTPAP